MTQNSTQGLSTRSIHGHSFKDTHGSPHLPVYDTTTFAFNSTADLLDVIDGRKPGSLYTRYGLNPSIFALEETLAGLESAEMAWSFCSGMAAETALFLTHGREGIVCIGDAYGGTLELLASQLPLLGIKTHLILGSELISSTPFWKRARSWSFRDTHQSDARIDRYSRYFGEGACLRRMGCDRQHFCFTGESASAGTWRRFCSA